MADRLGKYQRRKLNRLTELYQDDSVFHEQVNRLVSLFESGTLTTEELKDVIWFADYICEHPKYIVE